MFISVQCHAKIFQNPVRYICQCIFNEFFWIVSNVLPFEETIVYIQNVLLWDRITVPEFWNTFPHRLFFLGWFNLTWITRSFMSFKRSNTILFFFFNKAWNCEECRILLSQIRHSTFEQSWNPTSKITSVDICYSTFFIRNQIYSNLLSYPFLLSFYTIWEISKFIFNALSNIWSYLIHF